VRPTADAQNDGGYGEGRESVCGSEVKAPPDLPEGGGVQTASLPELTVNDRREVKERSSLTPNPSPKGEGSD